MKPAGATLIALPLVTILAACGGGGSASPVDPGTPAAPPAPVTPPTPTPTTGSIRYRGEVWSDNWFAAHVGSKKVAEDSVPVTIERSFNSETFTFDATPPEVHSVAIEFPAMLRRVQVVAYRPTQTWVDVGARSAAITFQESSYPLPGTVH
jgi:hypothetical protein